MDTLEIAEAIQYNLKNLAKLKNDPSYRTVYDVICGQTDTLVGMLEKEYNDDK